MNTNYLNELDQFAREILKEAGQAIKNPAKLTIDTKLHRKDLVTNMDKAIQDMVFAKIADKYQDHKFLGEEEQENKARSMDGYVWILDPIDGTQNFVYFRRDFVISLALFVDNVGMLGYVYDVVRDELYSAKKGMGAYVNSEPMECVNKEVTIDQGLLLTEHNALLKYKFAQACMDRAISVRMMGCCALEMIYVIAGRVSCYINGNCSGWDIAGAVVITEEMGIKISHMDGSEYSLLEDHVNLLVAKPEIHTELVEMYNTMG